MKTVKISYIPIDSTEVAVLELVDINRVQENLVNATLQVDIDDSNKANAADDISKMCNGTITEIALVDAEGLDTTIFTSYTKVTSATRAHYDADNNSANDNRLRLNFHKNV